MMMMMMMYSCGANVEVIGTTRGCQRHFRGFRGISWAFNGRENAETFQSVFNISRNPEWITLSQFQNIIFSIL